MTFDATMPGRPAADWRREIDDHRIPELSLDVGEVLVVAAHPDDETLGAGGLMAAAAARGVPVRVVVVTDGAASHPDSPTHSRAELAAIRAGEVRRAVTRLAPRASVVRLGFPDGGTAEHRAAITDDLRRILEATGPRALVVSPWPGDGHRDHRVVGEIVATLAPRVVQYPIWLWHWGTAVDLPWHQLVALPIDTDTKQKAIADHASQVAALSDAPGDEAMLDASFLDHFTGDRELFIAPAAMPAGYFDDLYARRPDPWGFETRWYERRKRALTAAVLPRETYGRVLEIGCSTGLVTELLAQRSADVIAVDIAAAAVERARARVGDRARVDVADVTQGIPAGPFDLIVLSEVGYYLTEPQLARLLDAIEAALAPGGELLACHWRHPVADYPLGGDAVHEAVRSRRLPQLATHIEADFLLELWSPDPRSVADREGLL